MGQRDRFREARRRSAAEAHHGVGLHVGDRGACPLGQLERHVLHDLVPLAHDERAEVLSERVTELLGLRVDDEKDARGAQACELVADPADCADREHGATRERVVGERLHAARSAASAASSFAVGGSVTSSRLRQSERPAGRGDRLLGGDAGMERGLHELTGVGVGPQDAEVGDDDLRPASAQPEPLAVALAVAEADRGAEVAALDERAGPLPHDDDDLARRCRDLGRTPCAGQAGRRVVVVADDRRVDVAEAVELRGAEEADVDAAGLQPVGEDLGNRHDGVGSVGEVAVADRERQPRRLRADAARLVDQRALRGVRAPGEVRSRRRQPDADEAHRLVAELASRVHDHQIVGAPLLRHESLLDRCPRCGSTRRSRRCPSRACRSTP